ncbi:MAG: G-D-S-L family lipolytic protein [Candidatus Gottesmanbacteria bacterium GW2011_GWA2_43_14]|uniref:G-D-S-L family lipolytic protein n=1 Tax=Candidatus Gottesmanbacteria bacterium GW2011_GWA2_43_14 TaxID=1618443 RepID=A0A0G1DJR0_9BACT|nr:MAG: G-D-S-L family lipolytic protein [Candidatus Gottesmanbacteria bacterium GW2011_GWA2_43_14]
MNKKTVIILLLPLATLTLLFSADKVLLKIFGIPVKPDLRDVFFLPPNTAVVYQGPEFSYLAKTNSLGFRGREYQKPKAVNTVRILAFGDSFTFGNGADENDIWITVLEKNLGRRLKDRKIEIFNLGQPGTSPYNYLDNIKKFVPLFNPDILLIGIVEGEDIGQIAPPPEKQFIPAQSGDTVRNRLLARIAAGQSFSDKTVNIGRYITNLFPYFSALLSPYKKVDIRPANMSNLVTLISRVADEQLTSIENTIDPEVLDMYLKGDLNPNLLSLAIAKPDFFSAFMENDEIVKQAAEKLGVVFNEISTVAENHGAVPFIVDIPYGLFISKVRADTMVKMGFMYSGQPWMSGEPVDFLKQAASPSGMTVFDNLSYFREKCADDCFFPYDGHFNAKGNKLLAKHLEEYLMGFLKKN